MNNLQVIKEQFNIFSEAAKLYTATFEYEMTKALRITLLMEELSRLGRGIIFVHISSDNITEISFQDSAKRNNYKATKVCEEIAAQLVETINYCPSKKNVFKMVVLSKFVQKEHTDYRKSIIGQMTIDAQHIDKLIHHWSEKMAFLIPGYNEQEIKQELQSRKERFLLGHQLNQGGVNISSKRGLDSKI